MVGLTEKQKAFVREYPVDFNGKRAAMRAGYSPAGAAVEAHKMLRKPKIQEALKREIKKRGVDRFVPAMGRAGMMDDVEVGMWPRGNTMNG